MVEYPECLPIHAPVHPAVSALTVGEYGTSPGGNQDVAGVITGMLTLWERGVQVF